MPLYDYECLDGGHRFEVRQNVSEVGNAACPMCASNSRRVFHSVPILFKGSGFYSTDHRKGQASSTSNGKEETGEEKSETKTTAKAEDKKGTKAEKKSTDKVASKSDS